jgi:hypothetical protein
VETRIQGQSLGWQQAFVQRGKADWRWESQTTVLASKEESATVSQFPKGVFKISTLSGLRPTYLSFIDLRPARKIDTLTGRSEISHRSRKNCNFTFDNKRAKFERGRCLPLPDARRTAHNGEEHAVQVEIAEIAFHFDAVQVESHHGNGQIQSAANYVSLADERLRHAGVNQSAAAAC